MMKNRLGMALALVAFALPTLAKAQLSSNLKRLAPHFRYETVRLPGTPFRVDQGDLYSLYLGSETRFVKTIFVRAETADYPGRVEVIANGSVVGHLTATPNASSPAMIAVRDEVNTLEFRHVSGETVYVTEIMAVQSLATPDDFAMLKAEIASGATWSGLTPANSASAVAKKVIDLIERLRPYVDARTDYVTYLLPIKASAGRAYSIAQAYGDHLSQQTRLAMMDLSFSIEQANRCLNDLMHVEAIFDNVVELRALKYEIDRSMI